MDIGEFDLIRRIRARAPRGDGVVVGIGDDAAVLQPGPGMQLVTSTDQLVEGRHFDASVRVEDLGHLALAVNLSDLAAMGARPRWSLLALTLPAADPVWLDQFLDGYLALGEATGCALVGGNLSRGPLNIAVTVIGEVEAGRFRLRRGARPGDRLLVTGTLGEAGYAWRRGVEPEHLLAARRDRPEPRIDAGRALRVGAHAMIDISDGLLADLAHLLEDGIGARIDCARLPCSGPLARLVPDDHERWMLQLNGGGDYELLLAWPPDVPVPQVGALPVTQIGEVRAEPGILCVDGHGAPVNVAAGGWDHFAPPGETER
ncbi:MAG: thiamine-phosphate kinase [Wenzhouxiangellaceae bacterium]